MSCPGMCLLRVLVFFNRCTGLACHLAPSVTRIRKHKRYISFRHQIFIERGLSASTVIFTTNVDEHFEMHSAISLVAMVALKRSHCDTRDGTSDE